MPKHSEKVNQIALPDYDLFAEFPYQQTVILDNPIEYRPISTINNSTSVITFEINTGYDEYIQFRETELYLKVRIDIFRKGKVDKENPLSLQDWKLICPVNNLLHSMIKQVTVSIGNSDVTSSTNTYSYVAYFDKLLYEGINSKKNFLQSCMWFADTPGKMEEFNEERQKIISGKDDSDSTKGQEFEIMDKLHIDLSNQDRAILGGCKISIAITPNDSKFYLLIKENLKVQVKILDAVLFVHKSKINSKVAEAHNIALKHSNAKYPITRKEVKSFNIPGNILEYHINDVYNKVLPRRIYVACVAHDAFNGSFSKNPFNFQHFNIRQISCNYNGMQYPLKPFQPDFENNLYIREYFGLYEASNQSKGETAIDITRFGFANGFTIFGFNFSPDLNEGPGIAGYLSPINYGNLRIEVKFASPLTEAINILVYSEFDSMIEINYERVGIKNF